MYNTPILFVFFNRPDVVQTSFKILQELKPSKLYLSCDGPRKNVRDDITNIEKCKNIINSMITWDCDIKKRFLTQNIGCSKGVSTAIDWFFNNEESGIILEDDCIPDLNFFFFCDELLEKYKNDYRVGMIAGYNQLGEIDTPYSYVFSKYKACWGWATWKRAWSNFDINMKWRETLYNNDIIQNMGFKGKDYRYWKYRLKMIDKNEVSAWDWQWYFSLASENQLCIFPKVNLISNIGFGNNATHTSFEKKAIKSREISLPLVHPKYFVMNNTFECKFYRKNNSMFYKIMRFIPIPIKHFVKSIIRRFK